MAEVLRVSFVCKANINRSRAMEEVARVMAERRGLVGVEFSSAGLLEPRPRDIEMAEYMVRALNEKGYTASPRSPQRATKDFLMGQDLVLTAKTDHIDKVLDIAPEVEGRVDSLAHYANGSSGDIRDPSELIGQHPDYFSFANQPYWLRRLRYRRAGYFDGGDGEGVLEAHKVIVDDIAKLMPLVIHRLQKERSVPIPSSEPAAGILRLGRLFSRG